jgi:hypothetical protein
MLLRHSKNAGVANSVLLTLVDTPLEVQGGKTKTFPRFWDKPEKELEKREAERFGSNE